MKIIFQCILLCVGLLAGQILPAQIITNAEYFWDADPGIGLGTPIAVNAGEMADATFSVSSVGQTLGLHYIHVRVQIDGAEWSQYRSLPVYIDQDLSITDSDIVEAEYFWDADPGPGLGTPISTTAGAMASGQINVPSAGQSLGLHYLGLRAKNAAGGWSPYRTIPIYIGQSQEITDSDIVEAEYFWDTDPGPGLATGFTTTQGALATGQVAISSEGKSLGLHYIGIRVKNEFGGWSPYRTTPVYIDQDQTITDSDLVAGEYFWDTDPGPGNATPLAIPQGASVTAELNIETHDLEAGTHSLNVRVSNEFGGWSNYFSQEVLVLVPLALENCPSDQTANLNPNFSCGYTIPNYTAGITLNGQTPVNLTQVPAVGTLVTGIQDLTVSLIGDDGAGTSGTCQFILSLLDVTTPTLSDNSDFTIPLDVDCNYIMEDFTYLVVDRCGELATVVQNPAIGTVFTGPQSFIVTFNATDESGNNTLIGTGINLVSDQALSVVCPADKIVASNDNCSFILGDYTNEIIVNTGCGNVIGYTVNQIPAPGTTQQESRTVTMSVTDDNGNSVSCQFNVSTDTVDIAPEIANCQTSVSVQANENGEYILHNLIADLTVTDNCGSGLNVVQNPAAGNTLGLGDTVVTITATDSQGNTTTCQTTVTVGTLTDDLAIVALTSPESGCGNTSAETIAVQIQNQGGNAVSNFDVSYTINGGDPVVQTVSTSISTGETIDFEFDIAANLIAQTENTLVAEIIYAADENLENNSFSTTINSLPGVNLILTPDQIIDYGDEVVLTASGGSTILWSGDLEGQNPSQGSITLSPSETQTYTVIVTNFAGCTAEGSVIVTVNAIPPLPDYAVKNVASGLTLATPNATTSVSWEILNEGTGDGVIAWNTKVYIENPDGTNAILVAQNSESGIGFPVNSTLERTIEFNLPNALNFGDNGRFRVELTPFSTNLELPNATENNSAVQMGSFPVEKLLTLNISDTVISEGDANGIYCVLNRTGSTAFEVTANLSLTNPERFTFPETIVFGPGQSGKSFYINAIDNEIADGDIEATLTASAEGFASDSESIALQDDEQASLAFVGVPLTAEEGETISFFISVDIAPSGDLTVNLASSKPIEFPVPPLATIAAGEMSTTVSLTLPDDAIPELTESAQLTISASGYNSDVADVLILNEDDIPGIVLTFSPDTVSEAAGYFAGTGTIVRTENLEGVLNVTLDADIADALILPNGISFSENEIEKEFSFGVLDNLQVDGFRTINVNASVVLASCGCSAPANSAGQANSDVVLVDNDGPSLSLLVNPLSLPEGIDNAGTLTITRNTATDDDLIVLLSLDDETEIDIPNTATIPAGSTSVAIAINTLDDLTQDGNQQVTITATAETFSPGIVFVVVTDENKPDLTVNSVSVAEDDLAAQAQFLVNVSLENQGIADADAGVLVRGYLSLDENQDDEDFVAFVYETTNPILQGGTIDINILSESPALPGPYFLIVEVNANELTPELNFNNNTSIPYPIYFTPDYFGYATVAETDFQRGEEINITGFSIDFMGEHVPNVPLEIYILKGEVRQEIIVETNAEGSFSHTFSPLPNEAGHFALGASFPAIAQTTEQDAFDILGARANNGEQLSWVVIKDQLEEGTLDISNLSDAPLSNVTIEDLILPEGCAINFDSIPLLGAQETLPINYQLLGEQISPPGVFENMSLEIVSDEANPFEIDAQYFCQALAGNIDSDISSFDRTYNDAMSSFVEFYVFNNGVGESGTISIDVPNFDWMNLVTPASIPSLESGDSTLVILELIPSENLPLNTPATGNLAVNATNANGFPIPFSVMQVSDGMGNALIDVVDQFTYFTEESPHVVGAEVTISNYFTGEVFANGFSDGDGLFLAEDLPAGTLRLVVQTDNHYGYDGLIDVLPGNVIEETVFIQFQVITFSWDVIPTTIEDEYEVDLIMEFQTNVPIPVVEIVSPTEMPQLFGDETYSFYVTLINHGLITAQDVELLLPTNHSEYEFVTSYETIDLLGQQAVQVPVVMRRREAFENIPGATEETETAGIGDINSFFGIQSNSTVDGVLNGDCSAVVATLYGYICGGNNVYQQAGISLSFVGYSCGGNPIDIVGGGGPGGGGCLGCGPGGVPSGGYLPGFDYDYTGCSTDDNNDNLTESEMLGFTSNAIVGGDEVPADAVCASVVIQISQQVTLTREAFQGSLGIFNGHPTDAMENISLNLEIIGPDGALANDLFQINLDELNTLTGIDGTGSLFAQEEGSATIIFIPEPEAAPSVPVAYSFGGTISYLDPFSGTQITLPLIPVTLEVNPSPDLYLHYFMQRDILGDDPLTGAVEPIVPAELALMIENNGFGPALGVLVESGQPEIIENENGLVVNFNLIGSNLQGEPANLGLTNIDFGSIPAMSTKIGQWYFTSDLLGHFINYETNLVHLDSYGNPDLSLISGATLHELIRSIEVYGAADDGMQDFLVNEFEDANDHPDAIYLSQGNLIYDVVDAEGGQFTGDIAAPGNTTTLSVDPFLLGWNYIKLDDPGEGNFEIVSITRDSDGQEIPLSNGWLTFVTILDAQVPNYEDKFHLVDNFEELTTQTYTIVWSPKDPNPPFVTSIEGAPEMISATQVSSLTVNFSEEIDASTFSVEDLALDFQGEIVPLNSQVAISQLTPLSFAIDISNFTLGSGFYSFTVQAAGISDLTGTFGEVGQDVTWTQFLDVPAVQAFEGLPEFNIAQTFETVQLLFNMPIDATTFDGGAVSLSTNGAEIAGTLVVSQLEPNLFEVSGLGALIDLDGEYLFSVDVTQLTDLNGNAGLLAQAITLTVDTKAPESTNLVRFNEDGLDNQHYNGITMNFDEDVVLPETMAMELLFNGTNVNIAEIPVTAVNGTWYELYNLETLTYPEGDYIFRLDMAQISDYAGNLGTGIVEINWTVDREVSLLVQQLNISPDLGFSNSDGITSVSELTLTYVLSEEASAVEIYQNDNGALTLLETLGEQVGGLQTVDLILPTGGNTILEVHAQDQNGNVVVGVKSIYVDQTVLQGGWNFENGQTLDSQPTGMDFQFSNPLLNADELNQALSLTLDGFPVEIAGLSFVENSQISFTLVGLDAVAVQEGDYEMGLDLSVLYKNSSGLSGTETVFANWIFEMPNTPPVAIASADIIANNFGLFDLNASASFDPEADDLIYQWFLPAELSIYQNGLETAQIFVGQNTENGIYEIVLWVSDGEFYDTATVTFTVNLPIFNQCLGDLNGDGSISTSDLLIMVSDIDCQTDCVGDLNGDGATTLSDLLNLISNLGCQIE